MSPPDPKVVKVAIATLATAGKQWSERGADLSHIPSSMGDLDMTGLQMGLAAPIHGVYEQIYTGIRRLIGGGRHRRRRGRRRDDDGREGLRQGRSRWRARDQGALVTALDPAVKGMRRTR